MSSYMSFIPELKSFLSAEGEIYTVRKYKMSSTEVSIDEMKVIVEMTEQNADRPDIAKAISRSYNTVYRYQKKLGLM